MKYTAIIIFVLLVLYSCNPCARLARHPECMQIDTVEYFWHDVRYEKVFITKDSIVYDTIPCDPVTHVVTPGIVYKTITKLQVDTFYRAKEVIMVNPVNSVLKLKNEKLESKIDRKNNTLMIFWIISGTIAGICIVYILLKKKL